MSSKLWNSKNHHYTLLYYFSIWVLIVLLFLVLLIVELILYSSGFNPVCLCSQCCGWWRSPVTEGVHSVLMAIWFVVGSPAVCPLSLSFLFQDGCKCVNKWPDVADRSHWLSWPLYWSPCVSIHLSFLNPFHASVLSLVVWKHWHTKSLW